MMSVHERMACGTATRPPPPLEIKEAHEYMSAWPDPPPPGIAAAARIRTGQPVLCGVLLSAMSGSGMHMLFGLHVPLQFDGNIAGREPLRKLVRR